MGLGLKRANESILEWVSDVLDVSLSEVSAIKLRQGKSSHIRLHSVGLISGSITL